MSTYDKSRWEVPNHEVSEFAPKRTKYCVCVPVINEGARIQKQLKEMKALAEEVDIIICDGDSKDGSLDENFLQSMGVNTLLIKKDKGKLSAQLRMGYAFAIERGYEGIVTIDGNNKDSVESINHFVEGLEEGYGLLQGSRYVPGGKAVNTPFIRWLAMKIIHAPVISLLSGHHYTDTTNGYRGYSVEFLLDDRVQPFRDIFETYELLAYLSVRAPRLGYKVKEVPVTRSYPKGQKVPTKISPLKGNLKLLKILLDLALGKYNPKSSAET